MGKPKVSIIVPIYNSEKKLTRCLDSLICQTFSDIEIILINDGSRDSSSTICSEYSKKDSRILYIEQENGGVSAARNHGLDVANGEYIMFSDSDDYYEDSAVEVLLGAASSSQADWILGAVSKNIKGCMEIASPSTFVAKTRQERVEAIVRLTENFMIYQLWGKLYRREIIEKHHLRMREEMSCGEDHEWICRFVQNASIIAAIEKIVYYYIVDDDESLSQRFFSCYFENIELQYQSAKNLMMSVSGWDEFGNVVRRQQAHRILSGYAMIRSPKCSLKDKREKMDFIQCGVELPSAEECRLHPECCSNMLKRILLGVKNPKLIYWLVVVCKQT